MPNFFRPVTSFCIPAATLLVSCLLAPAAVAQPNYRVLNDTIQTVALPAPAIGLMAPAAHGLRENLWLTADGATLDNLLSEQPASIFSPTLRDLVSHALLATALWPETDEAKAIQHDARTRALLPFITSAELARYLESVPKAERTVRQNEWQNDLALAETGTATCKNLPEQKNTLREIAWHLYCLLADNNNDNRFAAAQLQLDLLRERGTPADDLINLVEALIVKQSVDATAAVPLPTAVDVLNLRLLALDETQALNLNSSNPLVLRARFFALLERGGTSGAEAAEWLAGRGLITSATLGEAYNAVSFSAAEKADSAAPNRLTGAALRAYLWQKLQDGNSSTRPRWLSDFITAGGVNALTGARGALLEPYLYDITPDAENAWLAPNIFALAAAQNVGSKAYEWYSTVAEAAGTLPEAQSWLTRLWPVALAMQFERINLEGLPAWVAIAQTQPNAERIPVADVLTVLEGAGFAIPASIWSQITEAPGAGASGQVNQQQLKNLRAAAAANQQGEVILRANVLLQGGLKDAPTPVIAAVIRALADVELPDAAAALTIEALLHLLYPAVT